MQATEKIWMNGELVDWDDAKIHVGAHGLHYGTGVFEGIRCYDTPQGPACSGSRSPRAAAQLREAPLHGSAVLRRRAARRVQDVICANGLPSCYLRPIAFYGYGELASGARQSGRGRDHELAVGTYLGDDGC
jgi:branched-chain amino acid aminotransferase